MSGDIVIEAEQGQQQNENAINLREVHSPEGAGKHYRAVETWPITLKCGAVKVGKHGDRHIIHVNEGKSSFEGPGEYLAKTLPELKFKHPNIWPHVARGVFETEQGFDVRPMKWVDDKEEPDRIGIPPHQFAGQDAW